MSELRDPVIESAVAATRRTVLRTPVVPPPTRWDLPATQPSPGTDVVAIGADLQPGTLLSAYSIGLFPMPFKRRKIAWFSPDPRGVLPLDNLRISRSLRRSLRRYDVRVNHDFQQVMVKCADPKRSGAWIDKAFIDAYGTLHEMGWAHSVEAYLPGTDELVGGLYGVWIGGFFAGEAMFHTATDASKVTLVHLVELLTARDAQLLDVQWVTPHLASLGAVEVRRRDYLEQLEAALAQPALSQPAGAQPAGTPPDPYSPSTPSTGQQLHDMHTSDSKEAT